MIKRIIYIVFFIPVATLSLCQVMFFVLIWIYNGDVNIFFIDTLIDKFTNWIVKL